MRLIEIIRSLPVLRSDELSGQEATIYAAEPWTPESPARVAWSMPKGGLPDQPARERMVRLCEVRAALIILKDCYVEWSADDRFDELTNRLIEAVQEANSKGNPYLFRR